MKQELALILRNSREQSGLTQSAVAEKLGYATPQSIGNWERGISWPPIKTLRKLSRMYKVDENKFLREFMKLKVSEFESKLERTMFPKGK